MPTLYASQGYDTARLIGSALKATGGKPENMDAFRAALEKADFDSVRGKFRFGSNHHPVQDLYVREVIKNGDNVENKTLKKVFTDHADAYAGQCKL
jgi:branched-chain amino acid transport system substrate-binding protein